MSWESWVLWLIVIPAGAAFIGLMWAEIRYRMSEMRSEIFRLRYLDGTARFVDVPRPAAGRGCHRPQHVRSPITVRELVGSAQ